MSKRRGPTVAQLEAAARRQQAAQQRAIRDAQRARLHAQREAAQEHIAFENQEALQQTEQVEQELQALRCLLEDSLAFDPAFDVKNLKEEFEFPAFEPGTLGIASEAPTLEQVLPKPLGFIRRHFKTAQATHQTQTNGAIAAHTQALTEHETAEKTRLAELAAAQRSHQESADRRRLEVENHNREIDQLAQDITLSKPDAVAQYFSYVLEGSPYPDDVFRGARVAYAPDSKQLVIELELPAIGIVPPEKSFRYVKAKDTIESTPQPQTVIRSTYGLVVPQMVLRTLREVFLADINQQVDTCVVNAHLSPNDPATGRPIHPCLATVRTSRELFQSLDLSHIDPVACLKGLNASVSKSPAELAPVRPVIEFNMVDPRFVQEAQVLGELDERPNLMELSPSEFESLITNLFQKMGLETRLTRPSHDGGVDCVAYDPRPIFGGKVVIQAKRYKNTVGVSAVRDLFGTVQNEGASKGILVTTSGYGAASFHFANNKPLELLSGANLLALLADNAGIEAKIIPPEDWSDPSPELTETGPPIERPVLDSGT